MSNGTGSTLKIHPYNRDTLTMGLQGSEPYDGTSAYIVPLQTLRLNEAARLQYIYDQAPPGDGGDAIDAFGPLVPIGFHVVIKADSRAGMISAYEDLAAAAAAGGSIEYKPEDVGAGVLSTFYHYVPSSPPRLLDMSGNRWDAAAKSDGKFTIYVELEVQTQPAGTSDLDSPVTLSDLSVTLQNWVDSGASQTNRVTVQASNLKGTLPALVRVLAQPGADNGLGRLIVFKRHDGTLSNFVSIYEAEDSANIYPSVAWEAIADSERGGGSYLRCLPSEEENGVAQGRRFTISNPTDHEGRFAVFGVGREPLDGGDQWAHQVELVCGNTTQTGAERSASMLGSWCLIYAGEFELPPAPLSSLETNYTVYLDWYSTRASGDTKFLLDGIILVYVGDEDMEPTALDVACDDDGGVVSTEELLIENFPDPRGRSGRVEIAHVVDASSRDLERLPLTAPRGDFLTLLPDRDSLMVFVQERVSGNTILADDFSGYDSRILEIVSFDSDESWTDVTGTHGTNSSDRVEGDQAIVSEPIYDSPGIYKAVFELSLAEPLDLSNDGRLLGTDYLAIWVEILQGDLADTMGVTVEFVDGDGLTTGLAYIPDQYAGAYARKRNSVNSDDADLTDVQKIRVTPMSMSNLDLYLVDFFRIEKADPDDANNPNATGKQWDFQPVGGYWTLTKDVAGRTLACLDIENGVEKVALIDETTPSDVRFRARVRAKRDAGLVGIVWRAGDDTLTEGAEDCYAAVLDISNDDLIVREYANGSPSALATYTFSCAVDTWYVLGVTVKGGTFWVYGTAASNLSDDDDIFDDTYLLGEVEDATLTSGKCGVMSVSTLGRFDDVKLVSLAEKVVPADEITLEGNAIFRTIAPFRE